MQKKMSIEVEPEEDGRMIAKVPDLPGTMVYGKSRQEAISRVQILALRVLADKPTTAATQDLLSQSISTANYPP
jgi:predicted RNase H-like HicB family nuclease